MAPRSMALLAATMVAMAAFYGVAAVSDCVALLPAGYVSASRESCNGAPGAREYCEWCDRSVADGESKDACYACVINSYAKFGAQNDVARAMAARCTIIAANTKQSTHATDCVCRCILNVNDPQAAADCTSFCANCAALAQTDEDLARCACCVLEDTPPLNIGDPHTCKPGQISRSVPTDCHISPCYAGPEAAAILDMNLDSCRAMLSTAGLAPAAKRNDGSYTECEECTSAMGPTDVQRCYGCLYKAVNAYGMRDVKGNVNPFNTNTDDIKSAFAGCMELVRGTVGPTMQDCACECINNRVGLDDNNGGTPEACMSACRSCARGHKAPDQCTVCIQQHLRPFVQANIDNCIRTYK